MKKSKKLILCFVVIFSVMLICGFVFKTKNDISIQISDMPVSDINVITPRKNELLFSFTPDDFIDGYNSLYQRDYDKKYFSRSSLENRQISELVSGIHSPYQTVFYEYSAESERHSLPAISFYASPENGFVSEIALKFDWHSYTKELYKQYEQMCYYSLRIMLPEATDKQIIKLYTEVNKSGQDNIFPMTEPYGSGSLPAELFYNDGIGIYSYYSYGSYQRFCIIPVNERVISEFRKGGTEIYPID